MVVPEAFAYPIPAVFSDVEAAPLLCAGAIGYRSPHEVEVYPFEAANQALFELKTQRVRGAKGLRMSHEES